MSNQPNSYLDNLEHIQAQMAVLNLRLLQEVQRVRLPSVNPSDVEFKGLVLSDQEVDAILSRLLRGREGRQAEPGPLSAQLEQLHHELAGRTAAGLAAGSDLRLERLRNLFGLDDYQLQVMVICLAPELDLQYGTLYAYVQDDLGKRRPTVNLALNLLCTGLADRVAHRRHFSNLSPLLNHQLVQIAEDPHPKDAGLLAQTLALDPRVADYLLGGEDIDFRLQPHAQLVQPATAWAEVVLTPETRERLLALAENLGRAPEREGVILHLVGPAGTGKKTVAQALCRSLGKSLLLVDVAGLLVEGAAPAMLACREARLQGAILCWDRLHLLAGDGPKNQEAAAALFSAIKNQPGITIIAGETPWRPPETPTEQTLLMVELPRAGYAERKSLWQGHLQDQRSTLSPEDLALLVSKFRFSGGQIQRTVATARDLARWRSWDGSEISGDDLHFAARCHSNRRLERLAQRVATRYSWDDLILPGDQKAQLHEICNFFRNMPVVYGAWGFQSKASLGKGLNALFAGASGTGKTMSAEIVAGELGLDLYRIDLSGVVSKYIGETEKNLDRIFLEAQDSNAILLFDEADSLFGKRTEVRDSHDRYANIEISFLLQKMDEYEGISILTTNLRKNIDDAFTRRLHFVVECPFSDEEYRLQIWQRVFPPGAPLDATVDLEFLARQLKVAGGNIKNIAVLAAFLAAQEGQAIGMRQVIRAARREYQKMGKLLVESDFGLYFALVRGQPDSMKV